MSPAQQDDSSKRIWIGLAIVVAVVLALAWFDLSLTPSGPPPAQPFAPVKAVASAPIVAPPPSVTEQRTSLEMEKRVEQEKQKEKVAEQNPEPAPPPLRMDERAVSAFKIQHQYAGKSDAPATGKVYLTSRFQGRDVPAQVVVNGVWKGTTPMSLTLPPGMHRVRLDFPGAPVNEMLAGVSRGRAEKFWVELRAKGQRDPPKKVPKGSRE